jgi:hypothetical protein
VDSRTPEEAVVIASLRGRLAKQAEEFAKAAARGPGIRRSRLACRAISARSQGVDPGV